MEPIGDGAHRVRRRERHRLANGDGRWAERHLSAIRQKAQPACLGGTRLALLPLPLLTDEENADEGGDDESPEERAGKHDGDDKLVDDVDAALLARHLLLNLRHEKLRVLEGV